MSDRREEPVDDVEMAYAEPVDENNGDNQDHGEGGFGNNLQQGDDEARTEEERLALVRELTLGYQERVRALRTFDHGDPQMRPRLFIFQYQFGRLPSQNVADSVPVEMARSIVAAVHESLRYLAEQENEF